MNEANRLGEIADEAVKKARELGKRFDAVEHRATIKQLEADKIKAEKSSGEWRKMYQDIKGSLGYWKREHDSLKAETGERIATLKAELNAANEALLEAVSGRDMLLTKTVMAYNLDLVIGGVKMSDTEMAEHMAGELPRINA